MSGRTRAMTLLEVILAISLMIVLLGMMQMFYAASLRTVDQGKTISRRSRLAQAALARIARDIRGCSGSVASFGDGLVGDAHSITLQSMRLPSTMVLARQGLMDNPRQPEFDLSRVRYYIARDPDETVETDDGQEMDRLYGLVRWEQKTPNQVARLAFEEGTDEAFDIELWSDEIMYLGFRYFDGVEWVMTWKDEQSKTLPQAVKVVVGYSAASQDELDAETEAIESQMIGEASIDIADTAFDDRYVTVVYLPQADQLMSSRLVRARQVDRNLRVQQ